VITSRIQATLLSAILLSLGATLTQAQSLPDAPVERSIQIRIESPKLAEQGNAVVTLADFEAYLSRIPEDDRAPFLNSRTRVGQAIENLMLPRLLAEEARKDGFLDDPELHSKLLQSATVLIAQEYMDKYFSEQELEDYSQLARELYLTRPEQYQSSATVSFTHVLIAPNTERGELGMMREIFRIYEELEAGAELVDLAAEYSDDPGVEENGGRYVDVDPTTLDDDFALALSLMQPGRFSEPVKTQFGWHIIRLDGRTEAQPLSWEEAEERALENARIMHMNQARERLVQRLRADQLEVDPVKVQAVLDQYQVDWRVAPDTEMP